MKTELNEAAKTVSYWITRAEREDPALLESLKPQFAEYKRRKYTVAVFFSGERDLLYQTTGLLLHNQKVAARRDLKAAQSPARAMER